MSITAMLNVAYKYVRYCLQLCSALFTHTSAILYTYAS